MPGGRRMTRLRASWEYLRGTYWAVPSAMSLAAVLLSLGMIQLDHVGRAIRRGWAPAGGVVAAGVRDIPLSDHDRELIAQCHRPALAALHAPPGDQLAASSLVAR